MNFIHKASGKSISDLGGFPVIYADPPWSYSDKGCNGNQADHYPSMTFEEIAALPVGDLAAKDAVLFLWATYPKLEEALALIPRWGFIYKSIAFQWVKTYKNAGGPVLGLGRWTRGNTEPCLLAVRGKPHRLHKGVSQLVIDEVEAESLIVCPLTRHSEKPPEVRDRILKLMGDQPSIEMFARKAAPNWESWGNEVESTVVLK